MQAMTHSAENVQHCARAVELVVAGRRYAAQCNIWQTPIKWKLVYSRICF